MRGTGGAVGCWRGVRLLLLLLRMVVWCGAVVVVPLLLLGLPGWGHCWHIHVPPPPACKQRADPLGGFHCKQTVTAARARHYVLQVTLCGPRVSLLINNTLWHTKVPAAGLAGNTVQYALSQPDEVKCCSARERILAGAPCCKHRLTALPSMWPPHSRSNHTKQTAQHLPQTSSGLLNGGRTACLVAAGTCCCTTACCCC